ncbi:MAG TPA: hypothetical protein VIT68_04605 [Candidatus Gracilibacteria bacterium]
MELKESPADAPVGAPGKAIDVEAVGAELAQQMEAGARPTTPLVLQVSGSVLSISSTDGQGGFRVDANHAA